MNSVAALLTFSETVYLKQTLQSLQPCEMIRAKAAVTSWTRAALSDTDIPIINVGTLWSKEAILECLKWFRECGAEYLLWIINYKTSVILNPQGIRRMISCVKDVNASVVYGDYYDIGGDGSLRHHPLIDYQPGSIRDNFDFGSAVLLNGSFLHDISREMEKQTPEIRWGGFYELRLRLSERSCIYHLAEPLYCCFGAETDGEEDTHFAYLNPQNRQYQLEMEHIATAHLRRIGAFIDQPAEKPLLDNGVFPVKASIVIPVKNRSKTIGDAVKSALSQKTTFNYNVIVVDNHSTDGTTNIVAKFAEQDERLIHIIPTRTDLLIGGCWNEAIYSDVCGMYAVQLDSDDMYNGPEVLQRIIAEFEKKSYAVVIGSYTVVNFDLEPIPPGLVDHREWTDVNGHNNALRIEGLGAPRAYHVPTLRQIGFPNVSYGEDYAVVLRLSSLYPIGRIYESIYWCRRWQGNSDNALSLETANRYNFFKDRIRSIEIEARKRRKDCR